MIHIKDIKAFLQSQIDEIGFGGEDVDGLLKNKSMRCIEVPWVVVNFLEIKSPGKILDTGISFFDRKYFKVFLKMVTSPSTEFHGIDIIPFRPERFSGWVNIELLKKIRFKKSDIRHMPYPNDFFDVVFCISTIEHIGFDKEDLTDRKSSFDRPDKLPETVPSVELWDEDFKSMKEITRVLKPGGKLLLTVPFGKEEIIAEKDSLGLYALYLQYDEKRLSKLTNHHDIKVVQKQLFVYDNFRGWNDEVPPLIPSPNSAVACLEIEKVLT